MTTTDPGMPSPATLRSHNIYLSLLLACAQST
jgi:hypothetical protein